MNIITLLQNPHKALLGKPLAANFYVQTFQHYMAPTFLSLRSSLVSTRVGGGVSFGSYPTEENNTVI